MSLVIGCTVALVALFRTLAQQTVRSEATCQETRMMRNLTRSLCNSRQRMLSAAIAVAAVAAGSIVPAEPITMGSDRELFVDSFLIQELTGAALTLQRPTPREVSVVHDAPW